jgi:predicted permease
MRSGFPIRTLWSRKNLGPNLLVVWLLAVGFGVGTLLYSALDRLILHPLQILDSSLVVRTAIVRQQLTSRDSFEYKHFELAKHVPGFRNVAGDTELETSATVPGAQPIPVLAHMVSGSYFEILRANPQLGRMLDHGDERITSTEIGVVVSHAFWTRALSGSYNVLGSSLKIQGKPFRVIGVTREGFVGISLDSPADLWLPFSAQSLLSERSLRDPDSERTFSIFATLRSSGELSSTIAQFDTLYQTDALSSKAPNPGKLILEPISKGAFAQHDRFESALFLLLTGFIIMLAMMFMNIAAVLLVRSRSTAREIAIRLSLGAKRRTIVMTSLLEAILLGLTGVAAAILLDYYFAPTLTRLLPPGRIPFAVSLRPTLSLLIYLPLVGVIVSLFIGITPAWLAARVEPQQTLRSGTATKRLGWLTRVIILVQAAGTIFILIETALMIRTYSTLLTTDIGFESQNLLAFTVNSAIDDNSAKPSPALPIDLMERGKSLPGVESACVATAALMQQVGLKTSVGLPGTKIERRAFLNTSLNQVSESFFSTLKIPILKGRSLSRWDRGDLSPTPAVINSALAHSLFAGQEPIGRQFGSGPPGTIATSKFVVVGLAGNSKYRSLRESMPPILYLPIGHLGEGQSSFVLYVRAKSPPSDVIRRMRAILFTLNPTLPFYEISTMRQHVRDSIWPERLIAVLGLILSGVSCLMAAAGMYGLLAYEVGQRFREFGIRIAVGATTSDLAVMLSKESLHILGPGLLAGFVAHVLLIRSITPFLFQIRPFDIASLAWAIATFLLMSLLAVYPSIHRVIKFSPVIALKDLG